MVHSQVPPAPPPQSGNHSSDGYAEEHLKLAMVVGYILRELLEWNRLQPVTAATQQAANATHEALTDLNSSFASAVDQPYFGRLDFLVEDAPDRAAEKIGEEMRVYVGRAAIAKHNVFSWTAPVARLWYTNDSAYAAPKGRVRVRVDLKRFLRIRDQRLVGMNDIYRRALPPGAVPGSLGTGNQDALTSALSEVGSLVVVPIEVVYK